MGINIWVARRRDLCIHMACFDSPSSSTCKTTRERLVVNVRRGRGLCSRRARPLGRIWQRRQICISAFFFKSKLIVRNIIKDQKISSSREVDQKDCVYDGI
jgi:hypothetical protein